jgi:anti-anti-sigma factor
MAPIAYYWKEGGRNMAYEPPEHFRLELIDGVAVIGVLSIELNQPRFAQEFLEQLRALLASRVANRFLLDFQHTKYMSSTSFAAIFDFVKAASESGVRVAICGMAPSVRVGAEMLCLDQYVPMFDDQPTALAALREFSQA